jgi:hypothetical protein
MCDFPQHSNCLFDLDSDLGPEGVAGMELVEDDHVAGILEPGTLGRLSYPGSCSTPTLGLGVAAEGR